MARRGCDRSVLHGLNNNHTAVRLYSSKEGQPQKRPIQRALQNGRREPTYTMWINAMSLSRTSYETSRGRLRAFGLTGSVT
jgi:hypothetical protein